MTSAQVSYILGKYGYPINDWTSLNDITVISLTQDAAILVDPLTMRFYFNTLEETIDIVYGQIVSEIFISNQGETSNFTPVSFVSFENIHGFISSVYIAPYGSTYQKYFGSKAKM